MNRLRALAYALAFVAVGLGTSAAAGLCVRVFVRVAGF